MKSFISFLCSLFFILFLSFSYCLADGVRSELNNDSSNNSKPNNNNKTYISKDTNEDIFGDEQVFPFVAGLGKNAAH